MAAAPINPGTEKTLIAANRSMNREPSLADIRHRHRATFVLGAGQDPGMTLPDGNTSIHIEAKGGNFGPPKT